MTTGQISRLPSLVPATPNETPRPATPTLPSVVTRPAFPPAPGAVTPTPVAPNTMLPTQGAPIPSALPAAAPTEAPAATNSTTEQFRKQRDEARQQREFARQQRDEARRQRDDLRLRVEVLEAEVATLADGASAAVAKAAPAGRELSDLDSFVLEGQRARRLAGVIAKRDAGQPLSIRDSELLAERLVPPMLRSVSPPQAPDAGVAFLTVANDRFMPGLEAMLLSMRHVYPTMTNPVFVCHDGTLNEFLRERLRGFYPNLVFREPDMTWFDQVPEGSDNQKRIGKLGYMNMEGLLLSDYRRILLLDSDMLITGDLSPLWEDSDRFLVCYDCGDREYVTRSPFTGDWVFNSGVISIPGQIAGAEAHEAFKQLVLRYAMAEVCPTIDRFADQKIWNIFLRDRRKHYLPLNYNCNIKHLAQSLNGQTEGLSVIHFAGPKPWNNKVYSASEHITPVTSRSVQYPKPWTESYRRMMFERRLDAYLTHSRAHRRATPVREDSTVAGRRTCVMIGNGPSLARTDLNSIRDLEKFAFNWFILSDAFDEVKPDHLVLGSHMLYGGWCTTAPSFPEGYLEKLRSRKHRPVLWTSFYFREFIEQIGLHQEFEVNYGLFEKPFKRFVDAVGRYQPDLDGFLDDGRTGVLSMAVPSALHLGFERILLVGCDSNYNQPGTNAKYFYDMSQHTSKETREASLTATWTEDGRGQYVYRLVSEELARRDVEFIDCTVDGSLQTVRKGSLEDYAA